MSIDRTPVRARARVARSFVSEGVEAAPAHGRIGKGGGERPSLARILSAAALLAVAGNSLPAPAQGSQGNPGGSAALTAGTVVATFELAAPSVREFVLHGTLPIPANVFPSDDGLVPLQVVDYQDGPVPAQVETVTRYAGTGRG